MIASIVRPTKELRNARFFFAAKFRNSRFRSRATSMGTWSGMAAAGVPPRIMGIGPVPATQKLLAGLRKNIGEFHTIQLNEAFASQSLACLRQLGLPDDADHVNATGGAIALGHPLGMSGARLVMTAVHELERFGGRLALTTMCIGVGQGIAIAVERV